MDYNDLTKQDLLYAQWVLDQEIKRWHMMEARRENPSPQRLEGLLAELEQVERQLRYFERGCLDFALRDAS